MRITFALAPAALLVALPFLPQDPVPEDGTGGDDEIEITDDAPTAGASGFFDSERERIEELIDGTWILQAYQPQEFLFDSENIQGLAIFRDGYMSVNMIAQTFVPEFLGDGGQLYVQGGTHRYRISEFLELQTATMIGFSNFQDVEDVALEPSGFPREYRIDIDEAGVELRMTGQDETVLIWSRLTETEFPAGSLEALDMFRGK